MTLNDDNPPIPPGTKTESEGRRRPKELSAQLRFDQPVETVDDEWLHKMAERHNRSFEDFILLYLKDDYYNYLIADWRDAAVILRNYISALKPHVSGREICLSVESIVRGYEEVTTFSGFAIPDPIRLLVFVNEVVERALSVDAYRESIEAERGTKLREVIRSAVIERFLPRPARMVLQSAGVYYTSRRTAEKGR